MGSCYLAIIMLIYQISHEGCYAAFIPIESPPKDFQVESFIDSSNEFYFKPLTDVTRTLSLDSAQATGSSLNAQTLNEFSRSKSRPPLAIAPRNTAAVVGETVQLVCEVSSDSEVSRVIWVEFISRTGGEVITSDKEVLTDHPHAERYSVSVGSSTQFNLEIRDVMLVDGGKYMCEDTVSTSDGAAELIIFKSEPSCDATFTSSNGIVSIGQQHSITCLVEFKSRSIVPSLTWLVPWHSNYQKEETIAETYIRSRLFFTVTAEMQGTYVSCKTGFSALEEAPPNTATNAPQWYHYYNSTTLKIH